MNIHQLPIDLRINILEFGGSQHVLNIPDKPLIQRLKIYNPSFDINTWHIQISTKRTFINTIIDQRLYPLYIYIKDKSIDILIDADGVKLIKGSSEDREYIYLILKELGYKPTLSIERQDSICCQDAAEIREKLVNIWLLLDSNCRNISYNAAKADIRAIGLYELDMISKTLHIPHTLSTYLRYCLKRIQDDERIMKSSIYPLYKVLESFQWRFFPIGRHRPMNVLRIEGTTPDKINIVEKALVKTFGKDAIDRNNNIFYIKPKSISELIKIDIFYHPHVIHNIVSFK